MADIVTIRMKNTKDIIDFSDMVISELQDSLDIGEIKTFLYTTFVAMIDDLGFELEASNFLESIAQLSIILAGIDVNFQVALFNTYNGASIQEMYADYLKAIFSEP